VGAQWGDEGKGKVVDLVTERAELVVRYAGGPNAGHTLVVGGEKLIVRLVPSGILQPHSVCAMAQGMVVDPAVLVSEIAALTQRGIKTTGRLFISDRAHLILPHHILVDGLREGSGAGQKIGTTKKGIGPCYEDKAARRGLRMSDLADLGRARKLVAQALEAWSPTIAALGGETPTVDESMKVLEEHAPRLLPLITDTSKLADDSIRAGKRVVFEGAQGILLDLDHGTYPFVTSSSAVAGGACTGAGVGPTRLTRVVGITKAYATRVGEGPFPTELKDERGDKLRERGAEFGSVTGRPRRTGWLDLPALRYAARVSGVDAWAITKLDVLTGLDTVEVCTAYETPEGTTDDLPADLDRARPVFTKLPGWKEEIGGARRLEDLPGAARDLVRFIEQRTGAEAYLVSVGPGREETITVRDVWG
ncbi:MAG: adenylosuccinate synthase, partial [Polyangiaceae bacterium]|nr:adenylosuccinate synthase [Polyangiaceae bacterium]